MDVVIPCLNPSPGQLERAVASARKASCITRVIVVDDGSNPPIDQRTLESEHAPDLVVRLDQNRGPSAARNAGAAHARSEFILFLDSDDELLPRGVEALLEQKKKLSAVAGIAPRTFDEHAHRSNNPLPHGWANSTLPSPAEVFRPIELFSASALLVRKDVFGQGTLFDEDLLIGEDRDFLRKVALLGSIAVSSEPIVLMHRSGDTLTSDKHLARRVADHIVLLDRWCDAESNANFQSATNWLINACSKSSVPDDAWRALLEAAAQRGWPIARKPRVRRFLRSLRPAHRSTPSP
jgi:glycosyltransferase involved in cell wall biosynthesis